MTARQNEPREAAIGPTIYLYAVSMLLTMLWLAFLWAHVRAGFTLDHYSILLLLGASGLLLFPCLSRLKIGGLLEMEQRLVKEARQASVREAKRILLRGKVVQDEQGRRFYIDDAGKRRLIKDGGDHTAHFLAGNEGVVPVTQEDLEPHPLSFPMEMDSVLEARLLKSGHHIFVLLNGKRYWVGMDDLFEWGRHQKSDWEVVSEETLREYPRGR